MISSHKSKSPKRDISMISNNTENSKVPSKSFVYKTKSKNVISRNHSTSKLLESRLDEEISFKDDFKCFKVAIR